MIKLIFGLLLAAFLSVWSLHHISEARSFSRNLAAPPQEIKYFTLGMSNALADLFWLRLIQDMDYCGGVNVTEVNWEEVKKERPKCSDGWVAKMFHIITELSPDFYLVYRVGITALPIIVGDREGAENFIKKATARFPKDWTIAYRSAYFYIYEIRDPVRAAELLKIAGENGAPDWVFSLSARLFDEGGQLLLGISVLEETIKTTKEEYLRKDLAKKLAKLKAKYEKLKK
ncbi:MAG: hypothetical protein A4S09_12185 [Proteobacteria bacterium SG_bin7]|nr:MAG: hypothetical protein A4S09_12185 [Proteobacteria bacterium SG_bin7]